MAKKVVEAEKVLSVDELVAKAKDLKKDLADAKRGNKSGELQNPRMITKLRKDIARVKTQISELKLKEGDK